MSESPPRQAPTPLNPMLLPGFLQGPTAEVFANQMRIGVTLSDFALVFGVADERVPMMRERVVVHVAPSMLKQVLLHIQMAVSAYEEAVAPIPIPARAGTLVDKIRIDLVAKLKTGIAGPTDAEIAAAVPPSAPP